MTFPPNSARTWIRLAVWQLWMGMLVSIVLVFGIRFIVTAPDRFYTVVDFSNCYTPPVPVPCERIAYHGGGLDVVFTAQNYHDLYITEYALGNAAEINAAAFAALKPGGIYLVIDHSAVAGTPTETGSNGIHRIDQATVRSEIEAAGFVFDGEAEFLRNPEDPRTANVFDEAIRGRTDQFVMRFRKPE